MTEDQAINQAAAMAAVAYRNGDDTLGDYWAERVQRLSDQWELEKEIVARAATFDELKGSPDHSVVRHA